MRIAILANGYPAPDDDWFLPALTNFCNLLARGHDLSVFTHVYPEGRARYRLGAVEVEACSEGKGRVQALRTMLHLAKQLVARHNQQPFDLIHVFYAGRGSALGTWLARRMGLPVVTTIMGGELVSLPAFGFGAAGSWRANWFNRYTLRHADSVTVLSMNSHEISRELFDRNYVYTPFGVDVAAVTASADRGPVAAVPGKTNVLMAASLIPVKGHTLVLNAVSQLSDTDIHLHLVGDGVLRESLMSQCEALGVAKHVSFHGWQPHAAMPAIYRAADVQLMASHFETEGMSVLEGAACGCPAIGTGVGILPELADPLLIVAPGDGEALAGLLRQACNGKIDLGREGERQREVVRGNFDLPLTVARLERLYERLAQTGG